MGNETSAEKRMKTKSKSKSSIKQQDNDSSNSDTDSAKTRPLGDLTKREIKAVRDMWNSVVKNDVNEPGKSIISAILKVAPELKTVLLKDTTDDPATHDRELLTHAQRFNSGLRMVIDNLEDSNLVEQKLIALGKLHFNVARMDGFEPKYWNIFADSMIQKTTHWGDRSQRVVANEAWTKIVLFIIDRMKAGYIQERRTSTTRLSSSIKQRSIKESSNNNQSC